MPPFTHTVELSNTKRQQGEAPTGLTKRSPQRIKQEKTMPRLNAIDPKEATGKAKDLLDGVNAKLGMVPNLMRTFANSPAALEGYLNFSGALGGGCLL